MTGRAKGRTNYSRINKALGNVLDQRGLKAVNNGGGGVYVVTDKMLARANKSATIQGKIGAMERASKGQSVG